VRITLAHRLRRTPVDDPGLRMPDISLARSVLGWQPSVDLEKGLKATIDWFAVHHSRAEPCSPLDFPMLVAGYWILTNGEIRDTRTAQSPICQVNYGGRLADRI
jgi:hypothetical protein